MRRSLAATVLLLPVLVAGCVQLPDTGPVVSVASRGADTTRPPSDIDAEPPQPGESRLDVVNGFLEAMTAWPITTRVAKEYLTSDAAREWNPVASMVVYATYDPPTDDGHRVSLRLRGAARLDSAGAWRGAVPAAHRTISFDVVREDGEYRIADPPDQMLVPTTWFQQRFSEVALSYFDPAARYLVPEPVFAPRGDQLPTALMTALLAGPPNGLAGVVRTFLPAGLSLSLSVPVTNGVAQVDLAGGRTQPSAEEARLILAQVAATLRQDADLTGFRLRLNGQPVGGSDRVHPVDLDAGMMAMAQTPSILYGVARGRLVGGDPSRLLPVPGPLGDGSYPIDSFAMVPDGRNAVAVTDGGTTAIEAPTTSLLHPRVRILLSGASSLARPTVDLAGRVWLVDRRSRGAVVRCWQDGHLTTLVLPGATGQEVRRLLVSRDGTRLVAVVHRPSGDRIVGARVATAPDGRVRRLVAPFQVPIGPGRGVDDIAWASPTLLAVLSPTRPGSLYQVDIVPADGSTIGAGSVSTVIGGHVTALAGSPDPDQSTYAVLDGALVDVRTRVSTPVAARLGQLTYPG
ncbi:LpqB family beta-propeller domain-containing protein [Nocardioides maradonensis]